MKQDSKTTKDPNAVSAIDTTKVWAAGDDGTILYSGDAGSNLYPQNSTMTTNLYGISMNDDAGIQGWAGGGAAWFCDVIYFNGRK